jgi:hypothetical protein
VWDGASSAPTLLLDGASLNDLNPEELIVSVETTSPPVVQLFSDDGDMLVGAKQCKKVAVAARSFRVAAVQLNAVSADQRG